MKEFVTVNPLFRECFARNERITKCSDLYGVSNKSFSIKLCQFVINVYYCNFQNFHPMGTVVNPNPNLHSLEYERICYS